jgi:serine protease AprX
MVYDETNWLRGESSRLCPQLRKAALHWYRPSRLTPCFLQKSYTGLKKRWKKIPVIVQLDDESFAVKTVKSITESAKCKLKSDLPIIHGFSTEVNEEQLKLLVQQKEINKIWFDGEVHAVLNVATPAVGAESAWENGFTGKGVGIAVLDTGVYRHQELQPRITAFKDYINNRLEAYDDNGHGTHVAGCAAAAGETYSGPAREANIIGVKVLGKTGSGSLSTVIRGIQWCIDHRDEFNIRIINLSLGSEAYQSYREDPVCQAAEQAWHNGILVCCAAGNSGPQPRSVNSPGIHPLLLTVGASNDRGTVNRSDDLMADFSSRGPTIDGFPKPDVVAPGVNIVAQRSPGSFIDKQNKEARVGNRHIRLSGTSMATPVCAGVSALLIEENPALTPGELKSILMETAQPLHQGGTNDQGSGLIRVDGYSSTEEQPEP